MSAARPRLRVVVDGSNLATEGRSDPSLSQLDDALGAFREENPRAEVIVVVDASFGHRVASGERARFRERELDGTIVTPPAGAIGRGDAFILKIADRIRGVVLSNDSFQEFHTVYPWLFDEGRLIGGKPVPGVGWVFTPRLPVRGAKSVRTAKKLAVLLPDGTPPTIGTTITPVKKTAAKKTSAKESPVSKASLGDTPVKKTTAKVTRTSKRTVVSEPAVEPLPKPTRRTSRVSSSPSKSAGSTGSAGDVADASKPASARDAERSRTSRRVASRGVGAAPTTARSTRRSATTAELSSAAASAPVTPVVALRRGRQPVNPETAFAKFRATYKIGAHVEGEVTTFTSHGAVIAVSFKGETVQCYAPTTLLGDPAPARARDVLKRGDRRTFQLVTVDSERRIAELALR